MGSVRDLFRQKISVREIGNDRHFVYDLRRYDSLPDNVVDLKMFGSGKTLNDVCEENGLNVDLHRSYERRFKAILRSAEISGVDYKKHGVDALVPKDFFHLWEEERLSLLESLSRFESKVTEYDSWLGRTWRTMVEIERSGVYLDGAAIVEGLRHEDVIQRNFFKSMVNVVDEDDYVHPRLHPLGSRTYRFRVESGLQVMSIPHGDARKAVVSRFEGGQVCSIDYNAMDYRSMINRCDDKDLKMALGYSKDFHATTFDMLFGREPTAKERDQMKSLIYTYVYGGSTRTLCDKTGLSQDEVARMLRTIEQSRLSSVGRLKTEVVKAGRAGMMIAGGHPIEVKDTDHDGQVFALWAQTESSVSFRKAFVLVSDLLRKHRSRLLFPVHDELVLDVHPDELQRGLIDETRRTMEGVVPGVRLTTSATLGRSYHDATD